MPVASEKTYSEMEQEIALLRSALDHLLRAIGREREVGHVREHSPAVKLAARLAVSLLTAPTTSHMASADVRATIDEMLSVPADEVQQ